MKTNLFVRQFDPISHKEHKMNTHLNPRNTIILILAVLFLLVAATVSLSSRMRLSSSTVTAATSPEHRYFPLPRVRFAALEGGRRPAALEGGRRPAAQEGSRKPAALEGPRKPASLEGRRPPASLEGRRPPASLEGRRPPAVLGGRKTPAAQTSLSILHEAPLTLIDVAIVMLLAALLLVPVRKISPTRG